MLNTKKIKRYSNEIKYSYSKRKYIIYIFLITVIFSGLLIGNIINKNMNTLEYNFFKNYIDSYFKNFQVSNFFKSKLIVETIFKYGKSIIFIWLLGFINIGFIFTFIILTLKFISLSVVTSFFIGYYGLSGLLYSFVLYIPQNLVILPIYFYIVYFSINYNFENKNNYFKGSFLEYFLILLISMAGIFLISLYEIFITPYLVNHILSFIK